MRRILTAATREFRTTALTKAFLFGAIIFPIVIWAVMIAVTGIEFKRPPLDGTLAVIDKTNGATLAPRLVEYFDPVKQKERIEQMRKQIDAARAAAERAGVPTQQFDSGIKMAESLLGLTEESKVRVEVLPAETDESPYRERANKGEILALAVLDEKTMALSASLLQPETDNRDAERAFEKLIEDGPGSYAFVHGSKLRPDHGRKLKRAIEETVRDERFRRAGIEPTLAVALSRLPVQAKSIVVTDAGEKKSNDALALMLPLIFMMLIYVSSITGGQYLMMGTLEEKSSRVMEVILSAISPRELLIGKLIGQGLVGLAVLCIYSAVGLAIARQFNATAQIPLNVLPWLIIYFVMAYALIGSMMLAVGSAVTEIREAQALYTPITIAILLPFLLMVPIMQNPASLVARVFSYFPLTTPYVMVMRLAQPSVPVPAWELIATMIVGCAGVVVMVWFAAKIFRVGVLMYGKPPSLMEMIKWVRLA